jgi:hypothetical protein
MKIYLLEQTVNKDYDTYDSCIVVAKSIEDAITIHPSGNFPTLSRMEDKNDDPYLMYSWCFLEDVKCREIGIANDKQTRGVICASFNAG